LWNDLREILNKWVDIINTFEIWKKNKYLSISQNDEALEIKAQIENTIVKNDDKIEATILKTIQKLNKDTIKNAENILKEKINSWDLDAINEYKELLKIKKT
jgi:hypothetical protein